eukprot:gene31610-62011_t
MDDRSTQERTHVFADYRKGQGPVEPRARAYADSVRPFLASAAAAVRRGGLLALW